MEVRRCSHRFSSRSHLQRRLDWLHPACKSPGLSSHVPKVTMKQMLSLSSPMSNHDWEEKTSVLLVEVILFQASQKASMPTADPCVALLWSGNMWLLWTYTQLPRPVPSWAAALGIAEVEEWIGKARPANTRFVIKAGSPCWILPAPGSMFLGARFSTNTTK